MDQFAERVKGIDVNGIARVYAPTELECWQEAVRYIKRRPDTGPLDRWTFKIVRITPWDA